MRYHLPLFGVINLTNRRLLVDLGDRIFWLDAAELGQGGHVDVNVTLRGCCGEGGMVGSEGTDRRHGQFGSTRWMDWALEKSKSALTCRRKH
jgi:hypothetical protein